MTKSKTKQDFSSDLAKDKNNGRAKHGSGHWMAQRVTAVALIPLFIWFIYSVLPSVGASHGECTTWLAQPINAIITILFVISTFYHAVLGAQVITEDYIHGECFKTIKIVGQKLFFFAFGIACIFSILKIAFGG